MWLGSSRTERRFERLADVARNIHILVSGIFALELVVMAFSICLQAYKVIAGLEHQLRAARKDKASLLATKVSNASLYRMPNGVVFLFFSFSFLSASC